jgi:hypothetical protein
MPEPLEILEPPDSAPVEPPASAIAEPGVVEPGILEPEVVEPDTAPPPGSTPLEEPQIEEPGIWDKISGRFLGNDIEEDPQEWTRLGTTVAGGIAGGLLGVKAGTAAGAATGPLAPAAIPTLGTAGGLLGGAGGALLGAIAPEMFMEAGEEVGIFEEGMRERAGLSPEELRTVAEGEALLDLATGGGFIVLRTGGRLSARAFTGLSTELAERAARQGIDLVPVQVGNRIIGRGFVTVFGRFPLLGGGAIRRTAGKAEVQMQKVALGLADRVGPVVDGSELGRKIFGDATELVKSVNKMFGDKYRAIFAQADEFGVHVVPKETLAKADEILAKLAAETPAQLVGEGTPGPALKNVMDFIEEAVLPLREAIEGGTVYANQSLKQMDGLIGKIDQQIATLEPGQKRFALSLLKQLRQAAQADVIGNIRGLNAAEVSRGLKELDTEFSHTMSELFETATAKRFGSVKRQGLRGVAQDAATRTPVDQLARIVVNVNSPQAMDEVSRLVGPDTMRAVAAHTIDDAMQMAMKTDGFVGQLNIDVFAKRLGLDGTNAAKKKTIASLLEKSGSELTIQDLDDIVAAGKLLAGFDLPNVSSFIARRGAIGGLQSIINGVVPGMALLGGGAGAAAYSGSSVLGAITFIGGSHLFARVISNPLSARALHKVFDKEATKVIRRTAMARVLTEGLNEMLDVGEISDEDYNQLIGVKDSLMDAFDKHYEAMEGEK